MTLCLLYVCNFLCILWVKMNTYSVIYKIVIYLGHWMQW